MEYFFKEENPEAGAGQNMNMERNEELNTEMDSRIYNGMGQRMNNEMDWRSERGMIPESNPRRSWGMPPQLSNARFSSISGVIVELMPARTGNRRVNGCVIYASLEDMDGNTVNFIVTPSTFVVGWETLSVGMRATFWYRTDAPMPLIYPPQYNAVVAAEEKNGRMVNVDYYNNSLLNAAQNLQLNMDGSVDIRTTNNQYFQGSPANHNLVVVYENSTRSIPAQTTPRQIVVLCDR